MYKNLILLAVVFGLTTKCTSPTYQLKGVVQDGLNGGAIAGVEVALKGAGLSALTDNKGEFLLKVPYSATPGVNLRKGDPASDMVLIAGKSGYQQLEYRMSSGTTGMILNILPEPVAFQASDYLGDFIPFTTQLTNDVQWENIIDGVRLFYEKRVETLKSKRGLYWNRDLSSPDAYTASIEPNRINFRSILGAVDERAPVAMERLARVGETEKYTVHEVRWPVLKKVIPRPALQD